MGSKQAADGWSEGEAEGEAASGAAGSRGHPAVQRHTQQLGLQHGMQQQGVQQQEPGEMLV
jgi:hypothetical protein